MEHLRLIKSLSLCQTHEIPEFKVIESLYNMKAFWGLSTTIDLEDCDVELINSKEAITKYAIEICDLIKMKRYGEPIVVYFGAEERVAGYTLTQMIETSLVSAHFTPIDGSAYIDIFSCSLYNPHDAIEFSKNFFKATDVNARTLFRGK